MLHRAKLSIHEPVADLLKRFRCLIRTVDLCGFHQRILELPLDVLHVLREKRERRFIESPVGLSVHVRSLKRTEPLTHTRYNSFEGLIKK